MVYFSGTTVLVLLQQSILALTDGITSHGMYYESTYLYSTSFTHKTPLALFSSCLYTFTATTVATVLAVSVFNLK